MFRFEQKRRRIAFVSSSFGKSALLVQVEWVYAEAAFEEGGHLQLHALEMVLSLSFIIPCIKGRYYITVLLG